MSDLFHFPYYHIRKWAPTHFSISNIPRSQYDHLVYYQELHDGAIIVKEDNDFVYIIVNPSDEIFNELKLEFDYIGNISKFNYDKLEFDDRFGMLGLVPKWRIEYPNKPVGSEITWELTKETSRNNWVVRSPNNRYLVSESHKVNDPKDLIRISENWLPYLKLEGSTLEVEQMTIQTQAQVYKTTTKSLSGSLVPPEVKTYPEFRIESFDNVPLYLGQMITNVPYGQIISREDGTFTFNLYNNIHVDGKDLPKEVKYKFVYSYKGSNNNTVTFMNNGTMDVEFSGFVRDDQWRDEPIHKDIYELEYIDGKPFLRFPAWRLFGESVNNILPERYRGVPWYGASSKAFVDIVEEPFSIPIETGHDNITLTWRRKDWGKFLPRYKGNSMILDDQFLFTSRCNVPINKGLTYQFRFYFPINKLVGKKLEIFRTKLEGDEILRVFLYPKDGDWLDSINNPPKKPVLEYFPVVEYKGVRKVYCRTIEVNDWHYLGIQFSKNDIEIVHNNAKIINKIFNEPLFNIENFANDIVLFDGFPCLLQGINVYTYTFLIEEPLNHFIDFRMIDSYSIRSCDPNCPWVEKSWSEELNKDIYSPKKKLDKSKLDSSTCPFELFGFDPYTNKQARECSMSTLVPINVDYPKKYDETLIQSPHYKIHVNVNHEPFSSNAIVNESQCKLLYTIFESWRPISRVSHYTLNVTFDGDFSGTSRMLYEGTNANWSTICTITREVAENGDIYSVGETGFDNKVQDWVINHNLNSFDILGQSFDLQNRLMYPSQQYAYDLNTYVFSFAPNKESGYGLIKKAKVITPVDILTTKPVYVTLAGNVENAVLLQLHDGAHYRQEVLNFNAIDNKIKTELLETFDNGNINIHECDKMFYVATPSRIWTIRHNLGMMGVMIQVYDKYWRAIKPSEAILLDKNTVQLQFANPISGTVGFIKVGNPYWKEEAIADIVNIGDENKGYLMLGDCDGNQYPNFNWASNFHNVGFPQNQKTMQSKNLIRVDIIDFYETETHYFFIARLPAYWGEDLQIREIGLFNAKGNMCFYSTGNLIYIIREFELEIIYKLEKNIFKSNKI